MTDYQEKARTCLTHQCGDAFGNPACGCVEKNIAAALKEVAEAAVRDIGRCADCAGHKDPWIRESVYLELKTKIDAYESITPDDPEVKEALAHTDRAISRPTNHWAKIAKTLARAYRSVINPPDDKEIAEALYFAENGSSIEPTDERIEKILARAYRSVLFKLAEAEKNLRRCGGENCMGFEVDGVRSWVTKDALIAAEAKMAAMTKEIDDYRELRDRMQTDRDDAIRKAQEERESLCPDCPHSHAEVLRLTAKIALYETPPKDEEEREALRWSEGKCREDRCWPSEHGKVLARMVRQRDARIAELEKMA